MRSKEKILLIYPNFSSFVRTDYEILSEEYDVVKYKYVHTKNIISHVFSQAKLKLWLLKNILGAKAVYIWFADYHAFLPILFAKLFRKKSFLVLGGYDVTHIPEYNYGSFNNPLRGFCAKFAMQNATLSLAVSDNIKDDAERLIKKGKIDILYTGYDRKKFIYDLNQQRDGVISVIGADTRQRMYIKGIDLIVNTAKLLPDVNFKIIAVDKKLFENEFGVIPNIEIIDKLEQNDLINYYKEASVYIQLSIREGLPNSVCEAMLCGTIPVGTNAGGIPIAIGDCGYVSNKSDANEIAKLISRALVDGSEKRSLARKRILDNFSLESRRVKLLSIIKNYLE